MTPKETLIKKIQHTTSYHTSVTILLGLRKRQVSYAKDFAKRPTLILF